MDQHQPNNARDKAKLISFTAVICGCMVMLGVFAGIFAIHMMMEKQDLVLCERSFVEGYQTPDYLPINLTQLPLPSPGLNS